MGVRSDRRLIVAAALVAVACEPAQLDALGVRRDALVTATLVAPFDCARLANQTPLLSAQITSSSPGAVNLIFQVSATRDFSVLAQSGAVSIPGSGLVTWQVPSPLSLGTLYWRVALPGSGYSDVRSITIDAAAAQPSWYATTEAQFRTSELVVSSQTTTSMVGDGEVVVGFSSTPTFFDDFESGTLGAWTLTFITPPTWVITNAASVGAPSGTRVMKVVDLDTTQDGAQAMHDWGAPLDRGAIDFWMRGESSGPRVEGGFFRSGTTLYSTSLVWGEPPLMVQYVDNLSNITDLTPPVRIDVNSWHHYRIEYQDRGTYDVFMDGLRIGTNLPMQTRGDITRVNVHTSAYYTALVQDFQVDDVGVYAGTLSGSWTSPPISVGDLGGGWAQVSWTSNVAAGQAVSVQLLSGSTAATVPEAVLPGNAAGFTVSPVSLQGLDTVAYGSLRIRVQLTRAAVVDTSPSLDSLSVTGRSVPDAGSSDAGPSDAGQADAGAPDAGTTDGGSDGGDDGGTATDGGADAGPAEDGGTDSGADGGMAAPRRLQLGCTTTGCGAPLATLLGLLGVRRRRSARAGS